MSTKCGTQLALTAALGAGALLIAEPVEAAGVKVGVPACNIDSSWGYILGSSKNIRCNPSPSGVLGEHYEGNITKVGVDVGYAKGSVLFAAATIAPAVRQFMVFFDFDKSDLTPEAQHIVSEAVKVAKEIGPVRIVVTGHADNVGSERYTQRLSERRALAIKAEMVQLGMSGADIVIVGKGFSEPLIPTGEGIREPQNRRAVIDLGNAPVAMLSN